MRFSYLSLLLFAVFGVSQATWAAPRFDRVAIVSPPSHHSVVHRIEAGLYTSTKDHPAVVWVDPTNQPQDGKLLEACANEPLALVVTVGPHALEHVLEQNPSAPILAILIYQETFVNLIAERKTRGNQRISAIFLDQPISRHFALAKSVIERTHPAHEQVGMVLGPSTALLLPELREEAGSIGLDLEVLQVSAQSNPVNVLTHILDESALLLAIPDGAVYNSHTARGILLTAYRKKVPVIGYTQSYVKLGALVSIYVTPKQVAKQTVATISGILDENAGYFPLPQYSEHYAVTINSHVATLLGQTGLTEEALRGDVATYEQLIEDSRTSL